MATYQEQIEQNKQHKDESVAQTMVDLAVMATVGDALVLLEQEQMITSQERIAYLRKYLDLHPNIKKMYEGKF